MHVTHTTEIIVISQHSFNMWNKVQKQMQKINLPAGHEADKIPKASRTEKQTFGRLFHNTADNTDKFFHMSDHLQAL